MNYASSYRPVVVTYEHGGLAYSAAIHPIDHPGYLHSLFWFTNDFTMRTWGDLREPLEYAQHKAEKNAPTPLSTDVIRQPVNLTVRDGAKYAVLTLKVKTLKQYAEGLYSLLSTVTQVTGGTWYQAVHDILGVLNNAQAQLAAVNSISLGPITSSDAESYSGVVRPKGQAYHVYEQHVNYHLVTTTTGSFWAPCHTGMDMLFRCHTFHGLFANEPVDVFYQVYLKQSTDPDKHHASPTSPVFILGIQPEPGVSDAIEWDGANYQFRSDKSLCELPHPRFGWVLPDILWDKLYPDDAVVAAN